MRESKGYRNHTEVLKKLKMLPNMLVKASTSAVLKLSRWKESHWRCVYAVPTAIARVVFTRNAKAVLKREIHGCEMLTSVTGLPFRESHMR